MPGFFEAAANFKQSKSVHEVTVDGKTIEVSRDKKIEMIKNGIEHYYFKEDGTLAMREKKNIRNHYPEIETFLGNPYWPEEQFVWKR